MPVINHIPFSVNTCLNLNDLTTSPAHKRKLMPTVTTASDTPNGSKSNKKIDLDDNLVQQLFEADDTPTFEGEASNNKSAKKLHLDAVVIKSEPVEFVKHNNSSQHSDDQESLDLLANLNLESCTSSSAFSLANVKQEFNTTTQMDSSTLAMDDSDLKFHLAHQTNSSKFIFYWLDAYEDPYNQAGSVFLFGKTPIIRQKSEADSEKGSNGSDLTFASVCCVVKNIPKVVYVLPRKYRRSFKAEPGTEQKNKELVSMDKVNEEISKIMQMNRINSYKTKVVRKMYAFDKTLSGDETIPFENEYLQIEYNCTDPHAKQLSSDLEGFFLLLIFFKKACGFFIKGD